MRLDERLTASFDDSNIYVDSYHQELDLLSTSLDFSESHQCILGQVYHPSFHSKNSFSSELQLCKESICRQEYFHT